MHFQLFSHILFLECNKLHEFLNNDNTSTTITDSDTPTTSTFAESKSSNKDTAKVKQKVIDAEWHSGTKFCT